MCEIHMVFTRMAIAVSRVWKFLKCEEIGDTVLRLFKRFGICQATKVLNLTLSVLALSQGRISRNFLSGRDGIAKAQSKGSRSGNPWG